MGIYVHKLLGYGFTDVACSKLGIEDPRFSDLVDQRDFRDLDIADFLSFLKKRRAEEERLNPEAFDVGMVLAVFEDMLSGKQERGRALDWEARDSFVHEDEGGLKKVFLVVPAECPDWKRCDDMLDYIEEVQRYPKKGPRGRVQPISRPLYPYEGWMHAKTGERISQGHELWQVVRFLGGSGPAEHTEEYLRRHGFASKEEFAATVVPYVPHSVRLLCEWAGVFKDPKTALELRPLIYVYWA
jgi:hypothetical protein